ncbi:MAG TPA: endolytic transglycosylase MltG, partial [Streptosporangiaceae bacterium]
GTDPHGRAGSRRRPGPDPYDTQGGPGSGPYDLPDRYGPPGAAGPPEPGAPAPWQDRPAGYGRPDLYDPPGQGGQYGQSGLSGPHSHPGIRDPFGRPPAGGPYSQPGAGDSYAPLDPLPPAGAPGGPGPYSQPGAGDPFGPPGGRGPYRQPGGPGPYSQPGAGDRYGPPGGSGPYPRPGSSGPHSHPGIRDPFGRPPAGGPYSQPGAGDPGPRPASSGPYRQPGGPDPYSQPGRPYRQPGAGDPFSQPGGPGPGQASGFQPGYGPPAEAGPAGGYGPPGGPGPQGGPGTGPFRWRPPGGATGPQQPVPPARVSGARPQPPARSRPDSRGGWESGGDTDYRLIGVEPDSEAGRPPGSRRGPRPRGGPPWSPARGPADSAEHGGFIPGLRGGPDDEPPRRRRRIGRVLAPLIAIVLLVVLGAGGLYEWRKLRSPDFTGPGTGEVTVQVKPGDTATALAPRLVKLGVVASTNAFISAAKKSKNPAGLEPGYFQLHKHMNAALAWALLLNPKSRLQTKVTIPDGLRLTKILSTLAAKTGFPLGAYQQAAKDPSALGLPKSAGGSLEGYLYPATYTIQHGSTAQDVLKAMVARYKQEVASLDLADVAARKHTTPAAVIVVASLVEAEAGKPVYYGKVARVIWNRLNDGIKLQLDSTVLYALHKFGFKLTQSQMQVNSPYNTFMHAGLPPGPIDSPGEAAIKAALNPTHGTWIYFVTVNPKTGLTKFTDDPDVFARYEAECKANGAC